MTKRIVLLFLLFFFINLIISFTGPIIGLGRNESYFFYQTIGLERKNHFLLSFIGIFISLVLFNFNILKKKVKIVKTIYRKLLIILKHCLLYLKDYFSNLRDGKILLIFCISVLMSFFIIEVLLRLMFYNNISSDDKSIVIYSKNFRNKIGVLGLGNNDYIKNIEFKRWVFDTAHDLGHESKVKTNNYGFISEYKFNRLKNNNEFRVAIIGDSLTASITSDIRWVDELQKLTNENSYLKNKNSQVTFYNFGSSGSGFRDFIRSYCIIKEYFSPDLIVTNFISDDAYRIRDSYEAVKLNSTNINCEEIISNYKKYRESKKENVSEVSDDINVFSICDKEIEPKDCRKNIILVADERVVFSKERMIDIRKNFFQKKALDLFYDVKTIFLVEWLKSNLSIQKIISNYYNNRNIRTADKKIALKNAKDYVDFLEKRSDKHILFLNPVHSELVNKQLPEFVHHFFSYLDKKEIKYFNLLPEVLDMKNEYKDFERLFNIPHDGHFSDYGSKIYAKIIYKIMIDNNFFINQKIK